MNSARCDLKLWWGTDRTLLARGFGGGLGTISHPVRPEFPLHWSGGALGEPPGQRPGDLMWYSEGHSRNGTLTPTLSSMIEPRAGLPASSRWPPDRASTSAASTGRDDSGVAQTKRAFLRAVSTILGHSPGTVRPWLDRGSTRRSAWPPQSGFRCRCTQICGVWRKPEMCRSTT